MARYWYSYKCSGSVCVASNYTYTGANPNTFCPNGAAVPCAIYATSTLSAGVGSLPVISPKLCAYISQTSNHRFPITGFPYVYKKVSC